MYLEYSKANEIETLRKAAELTFEAGDTILEFTVSEYGVLAVDIYF